MANIYINRMLKAFDKSDLMKRCGAGIVNYADDFVVLCEHSAAAVLAEVRRWIVGMKLALKHCEVYARFKTTMDCGLYHQFLGSRCDLPAPPGEMHCRKTSSKSFHAEWFFECTKGDLTFADVHDGEGWVR